MLLIVEGVDGAGKTTLVEQLVERLGSSTRVLHRGPPTRHPLEEYELELQDYVPGSSKHIICDRWHWGELVYGPLYRGKSALSREAFWHVNLFLQARGAGIIHLWDERSVIERRLAKRGEDFLQQKDIGAALDAYWALTHRGLRPWNVNSSRLDDDGIDAIVADGTFMEYHAAAPSRFSTYVGARRPSLLLLGERRGGMHPDFSSAFVPMPGTSGQYLLSSLADAGYEYQRIGIANACEEDVVDLWRELGSPRTVTLGRLAHEATPFKHGAAPHPQFIRRFFNAHTSGYASIIERAAADQEDHLAWRP